MNDRNASQKQNISGLMVLLLFGVFAVCILSVLLSGTGVYDRLTARDETSYDSRTAVQYLTTRVHQAASPDALSIRTEDGVTFLCFTELLDGAPYETRLYCRDGWLKEQFLAPNAQTDWDLGERILPADDLSGTLENGLLTLNVRDQAGEQTVCVLLRGGEAHP